MARWEEVVDQQLDTVKFWRSPRGKQFAQAYTNSVIREAQRTGDENDVKHARSIYSDLGARMTDMLERAEPVWVDPDMWAIIEVAHKSFEPEPLLEQDLIVESGFLVLPQPITMVDVRGKNVMYRAFAWYPMSYMVEEGGRDYGILLAMYSATKDKDDYYIEDQEKESPFLLSHLVPWLFNETYPENRDERGLYGIAKWVQSMWRLMSQTITVQSRERPAREVRKRLARANFPDKNITVIRLRRPKYPPKAEGEVSEVEWTRRWLVAGHWRNQPYPSLGETRQIWISPYIKGPEDMPLVIREKRVFTLVQ